ncbi:MAG: molybdopterin-dependent oxidoreductase [Pseudomonadales bacterium]
MSTSFDRRDFLKVSTASALSLMLPSFHARTEASVSALLDQPAPAYTSWMDVYREQFTWDSVHRGTHLINCWYQSHCAWDVYVKDGLVFREEQAAEYPQTNSEVPDFNPRGCQKGACFSQRMYDPVRVKYPLRRVGPRGGGRWERVSWEEALRDIASTYLDVTLEEGTNKTIWDVGASGLNLGATHAGQARFASLTRCITLDPNPFSGDGHRGAYETFGNFTCDRSMDDFFYSDLILIWGSNPIYTSIPNAHFLTEARYNGTRTITIAPDYSPTATKSDLWIPVRPGTDAALALAVAHLLIEEGQVNEAFMREQTDFPLLVRQDTGRFLTERDLQPDGRSDRFLFLDSGSDRVTPAPDETLQLGERVPDLDVRRTIRLGNGQDVEVRSVFSMLRERLRDYTPEAASELCGTSPELIRRFAKDIAAARNMSNVPGSSLCKYYHGNLTERAIILIFCLTGQMGRRGAGYSGFSLLNNDGWERFVWGLRWKERVGLLATVGKMLLQAKLKGRTRESVFHDIGHLWFGKLGKGLPIQNPGSLFWHVHGGISRNADEADAWDPFMKRRPSEYLTQSLTEEWYPLEPPPDQPPRILIHYVSNALRRVRASDRVIENLWPKLKLVVTVDWRMSSTTRWSDYILPASTWYERTDHKWVTPQVPFHHLTTQATPPLGESMSDWKIVALLAKEIQKQARQRGISEITAHDGETVDLDRLYDDLTMDGRFKEDDDEAVARVITETSSNLNHLDWDELKEKGFGRFRGVGDSPTSIGNMAEMKDDETFAPFTFHVRDKQPYVTATRRIQFYLDHDLYLELDEALPRYKEPPAIGGDYPLVMTGGHTRWSIHGVWRDNEIMLRLNRGGPFLIVSPVDAAERGIGDGDWVKVFNDFGSFNVRVKTSDACRPRQTLMYHSWETYQFDSSGDPRQVSPTPINPVELAGGHPHLRVGYLGGQPSGFDRDTRIEIRPLQSQEIALMRDARVVETAG